MGCSQARSQSVEAFFGISDAIQAFREKMGIAVVGVENFSFQTMQCREEVSWVASLSVAAVCFPELLQACPNLCAGCRSETGNGVEISGVIG